MGSEKLLFRLEQPNGNGEIYINWQNGSGNYLAVTGVDSIVNIFDRYGQIHDRVRLQSLCSGFDWDTDGDLLAIICQSPQVIIWDSNTGKKQTLDVGLRDNLTCLVWGKNNPLLALGSAKGNVSIYNHTTSKRVPIIGKHSKKITCGSWNSDGLLALGSEDKTISVSNSEGDTIRVIALRAEPVELQFSEMKLDTRVSGENTVSVIVGKKTLYLYNLLDPENPIELAFQQHYGSIVTYKWFGDGYILLGFSGGYFIAISTHIKEVGQELFQIRNHKINLTDIAICQEIGKVASCGDNNVKIHDISNLQETVSVITVNQEVGLERISWSKDGQLLAVCTQSGSLNVYISNITTMAASCGLRIAVLSSLTEVSLYNYTADKSKLVPVPVMLDAEPSYLAVGPFHLVAGMNNRAWFYDLTRPQPGAEDSPMKLKDRLYLGGVTSIQLNAEYASVLFEGKIQLHLIEPIENGNDDKESLIFPPESSQNSVIKCHALTTDFLIYGTEEGQIVYFYIEQWAFASEFKHSNGINDIFVDPAGTRMVFIDIKGQAFVYNGANNDVIPVPHVPIKITGVVWDSNLADRNIFILFNEQDIFTYIYTKFSVYGTTVKQISKTTLASKQIPLLMYGGDVMCATNGGSLSQLTLNSHNFLQMVQVEPDQSTLEANLKKQLNLQRFTAAWNICLTMNTKNFWRTLGEEALKHLELETATRAYQQIEDVAMVESLHSISHIEDCKLLAGYISMFLGNFDDAQQWFLKSSNPIAALEMRRDLLQWDQALHLAKKMAPEQVPQISKEYAQQLEFIGNHSEALLHYEKGLQENRSQEHTFICKAGVARCSMRLGNFKHGISLCNELNNKHLYKECADILESKKQLNDAALLYEKALCYDKAATSYIKLKNWNKIGEILPNVTSNKVYLQFARAKEHEGNYQEAANAYYTAKDFDSVIRLQLDYLNNPEIAVELVQETKSTEGAKLVARFFQRLNDYTSAIKFLVMSRCHDEAFELARKHSKLQLYGEILLNSLSSDEIRAEDFNSLALHFENERNHLLAGKYWFHAKEYAKAMKHLLKAAKSNSDENEAITLAIDVVASSNDDSLAKQLIEYLLGEVDGMPKEPKYLFRLYMARKQYREASKSAVIIANEEQINGNYRNAHDVLFGMYQELKQNNIKIPNEMHSNLMLLHSYILVRLHVRRGDHLKGARLLIRVANNISKFPSHVVPILTSTVIECHRAGLRQAAFKYATMLMNPDYRKQIDAKYAKKIEAVVRKPPKIGNNGEKVEDPDEPLSPCPFCDNPLPETEITCNSCKNNIPFCIITGRHIVRDDFTVCPECNFPALYSHFLELLETEDSCPMCSEKIDSRRLGKIEVENGFFNI